MKTTRKKLYLAIGLVLALAANGIMYAGTWPNTTSTVDVTAAEELATSNASANQPDWDQVLPAGEYDQEVLLPNGPGDLTVIASQFPSSGEHWDKVDDPYASPDDWTTYIFSTNKQDRTDLFSISDHVQGMNEVSGVTVNYRIASDPAGSTAYARAAIKTGGTVFEGITTTHVGGTFTTYSHTWANNPDTGSAWTWSEVDALQAGVTIAKEPSATFAACTQVYVVIDYQLPPITGGEVPTGDLTVITPSPAYNGDVLLIVYLTNTGALRKAYQYLNLKLYMADSLEAGLDPDYQLLTLENGVAFFNIEGGTAPSYTLEVTGGSYGLISGDMDAWGAGYSITPEFYFEVSQR